jgi:hypothetical protein
VTGVTQLVGDQYTYNNLTSKGGGSGVTGAIVITTNIDEVNTGVWINDMDVSLYNYNASTQEKINLAFYKYYNGSTGVPSFVNRAYVRAGSINPTIRLAINSSGKVVVIIGETDTAWSYPQAKVNSVVTNVSDRSKFEGWSTAIGVTDLTGYTYISSITDKDIISALSITQIGSATNSFNGNVGIGTTAPGQKLDVRGNIDLTGDVYMDNNKAIRIDANSHTNLILGNFNDGGFAYGGTYNLNLAVEGDVKANRFCIGDADCKSDWTSIGGASGWTDDGTTVRLTTASDNVGIGTASPSAKLEVNGTAKINGGDFEFWFDNTTDTTAAIDTALRLRKNDGTGNFHKYINTAGGVSPVYETDGFAYHELYNPGDGIYRFQTATSGLAGNAISWLDTLAFLDGNVGVGTTAPGYKLHVNGTVYASQYYGGACDIAERYNADDEEKGDLEPGDILSLSRSGDLKVGKSKQAYDTMVIGVFSTDPMLTMGEFEDSNNEDNPPVALLGRVPTKVTNENGAIEIGDLIVSSSKEGHGMKCDEYSKCQGAVVGKALENFNGEEGVIEVLINVGM